MLRVLVSRFSKIWPLDGATIASGFRKLTLHLNLPCSTTLGNLGVKYVESLLFLPDPHMHNFARYAISTRHAMLNAEIGLGSNKVPLKSTPIQWKRTAEGSLY